jgi:hypothetical protein
MARIVDFDEAYRLQYQARRGGHFAEEHYWDRYRQGLEERGPRRKLWLSGG